MGRPSACSRSGGIALPYLNAQANTIDEFEPLAFFGEDPNALQVSIASGINSLKEYVERARANPGKLRNGNDQPGGSSFLAIAQYEKAMNFKVTRVSYAGFAPTVTALLGGEVDSATVAVPDTIEHHKNGKLKILGVSAAERHYMAPDVPTFKEQGYDVDRRRVALPRWPEGHAGRPHRVPRIEHPRRTQGPRVRRQGEDRLDSSLRPGDAKADGRALEVGRYGALSDLAGDRSCQGAAEIDARCMAILPAAPGRSRWPNFSAIRIE